MCVPYRLFTDLSTRFDVVQTMYEEQEEEQASLGELGRLSSSEQLNVGHIDDWIIVRYYDIYPTDGESAERKEGRDCAVESIGDGGTWRCGSKQVNQDIPASLCAILEHIMEPKGFFDPFLSPSLPPSLPPSHTPSNSFLYLLSSLHTSTLCRCKAELRIVRMMSGSL